MRLKIKSKGRITFDFDLTLELPHIQDFAKEVIDEGFEVWVVTSRNHSLFSEVKEVTDKMGILSSRVIFTSGKMKLQTILDLKPIMHLDDDTDELCLILEGAKETKPINVYYNDDWLEDARKVIKSLHK